MNRGKYTNDDLYREGYLDGRRDGVSTLSTTFKSCLDKLKEKINYLEQRYYEINEIEKELPLVTPQNIEKPLGRWVDMCGNDGCSVCGEEISDAQTFDGRPFKYCPMCGAKMESEDKE